ncbi:coiled-coil domain-containing protein 148 isoform X1 [Takifugu rubripes]|uniref:Coiled-coil domain containing 148 n=1 Tax=Takifugu rubripes TaxID=31033 RepID=A0A3B5KI49_TAKRU|nr:coiled-coil domain-containing protein 148 isoform X1 [Takifugu rubripes]|eukprot:XP_011608694.1 PREDICTED: coiled-coil domain-containing protein 148 isoform X1 [Takifugu rubripes]
MSGTQRFNTSYSAEGAEKLTIRMKNGAGISKYKPVDYERLQAIIDAKRLETDALREKNKKLQCEAKATKESGVLRQQRQVWCREYSRLKKAEEKAEKDLYDFLEEIVESNKTDPDISILGDYALLLQSEQDAFRDATVEPIFQLKEDLKIRLAEEQHQQRRAHHPNWEQVLQQIQFVKDQQAGINDKLDEECFSLEEEINSLRLEEYLDLNSVNLVNLEDVPKEVLDSDCPYPELKACLHFAFHSQMETYQKRLQTLQQQLGKIDRFGGWCTDDHQRFLFTLSQYTRGIANSRELCMDMLQRLFPDRTRKQLLEHERVWDMWRYTHLQLKVVTQQWQRDYKELVNRALVTLEEAKHAHQEELKLQKDRKHQRDVCLQLRKKLQQWRAQQEEVATLEGIIAARQREREEARLKRDQEKEMEFRTEQREKIRQFHVKQRNRMYVVEQRERERLAHLRGVMEEQAREDRERVQFRADLFLKRWAAKQEQEFLRQKEEEEIQNRLEALRIKVRVVAEGDPDRMMAHTEAWKSQHRHDECEVQRPLYPLNTYTDAQIMSDPRVRAEQSLWKAGLHHSQYAKKVLSTIHPPKPPRRDTKSTLKF